MTRLLSHMPCPFGNYQPRLILDACSQTYLFSVRICSKHHLSSNMYVSACVLKCFYFKFFFFTFNHRSILPINTVGTIYLPQAFNLTFASHNWNLSICLFLSGIWAYKFKGTITLFWDKITVLAFITLFMA